MSTPSASLLQAHRVPRSRSARFLVVILAGLGAPTAANAPAVQLPEISVYANQAPTDIGKVGVAVTVLRGADLRAQGYNNVPDALRTVPGVEVSQSGNRGSLTHVSIRGSEAKHVLVLIDGV